MPVSAIEEELSDILPPVLQKAEATRRAMDEAAIAAATKPQTAKQGAKSAKASEGLLSANEPEETESEYLTLDSVHGSFSGYLTLNREQTDAYQLSQVKDILYGADACRFLGLPVREHFHITRTDYQMMEMKFEKYLKELTKQTRTSDFWRRIKIRAYNKRNLLRITPTEIKGAVTPAVNIAGVNVAACEYTGELVDGEFMKTTLNTHPNSKRWETFLICIESVEVTEEFKRYATL